MGESAQGDLRTAGPGNVDIPQRIRALPETGSSLHNNVVLVKKGIGNSHLALAKSIIQGVVEELRCDAKPGCGSPVDDERGLKPFDLLVAADICNLRQCDQLLEHTLAPRVEFCHVISLQRELIKCVAYLP